MKKIKLGKKIQLLEDFSASDLSKPSQSVTPAAKTKIASITVDKVVAQPTEAPKAPVANVVSGEEVRAEIIKDVDAILNNLDAFKYLKCPILTGTSRKSMIYKLLDTTADNALNGTTITNTMALLKGANILRVHDVKQAIECIKITTFAKNNC